MCYEQRRTSSSDTKWLIRHIPLQKNRDRLVIISKLYKETQSDKDNFNLHRIDVGGRKNMAQGT